MDEYSAACRAHWCGIEVVGSEEVFPGRYGRLCVAGAQKVKGEFCLGKEQIPAILGKVGGHTCLDGQEVVLKCADGSFGFVASVDVWGHELKSTIVGRDGALEGGAGLVIQDVERRGTVNSLEPVVDFGVGRNAMGVMFGGKGSDEDGIGVIVDRHHDVLIATAGAWREPSCVVREDAGDGECVDGDGGHILSMWLQHWGGRDGVVSQVGCGPNVLPGLGHVAHSCFDCVGAVAGG